MIFANGPSIPTILNKLFEGTSGEEKKIPVPRPDRRVGYRNLFNIVCDLGCEPNVAIMPDGFMRDFDSEGDAVAWLCKLRGFEDDKEEIFRRNLQNYLTPNDGGVIFYAETRRRLPLGGREKGFLI